MSSPVFIIDTNVLVAGLITGNPHSPVIQIVDRMLNGQIIYTLSPAVLNEYRRVLLRPKLTRLHKLGTEAIEDLLEELTCNAIWREPTATAQAPDPGDNHLWALLAAYPGSTLITGDKLLIEQPPSASSVISPGSYISGFVTQS